MNGITALQEKFSMFTNTPQLPVSTPSRIFNVHHNLGSHPANCLSALQVEFFNVHPNLGSLIDLGRVFGAGSVIFLRTKFIDPANCLSALSSRIFNDHHNLRSLVDLGRVGDTLLIACQHSIVLCSPQFGITC